jgi:hypothetical protein
MPLTRICMCHLQVVATRLLAWIAHLVGVLCVGSSRRGGAGRCRRDCNEQGVQMVSLHANGGHLCRQNAMHAWKSPVVPFSLSGDGLTLMVSTDDQYGKQDDHCTRLESREAFWLRVIATGTVHMCWDATDRGPRRGV